MSDDAPAERTKRIVVVLGSVGVTLALAFLAFWLGAWGFGFRRHSLHEGRLQRLLPLEPTLQQIVAGLAAEGAPLVASAEDARQLAPVASERGGAQRDLILAKGRRYKKVRVFLAGDMVYFIYFDSAGVMRDFVCVGR
jgi:hypothetical protein